MIFFLHILVLAECKITYIVQGLQVSWLMRRQHLLNSDFDLLQNVVPTLYVITRECPGIIMEGGDEKKFSQREGVNPIFYKNTNFFQKITFFRKILSTRGASAPYVITYFQPLHTIVPTIKWIFQMRPYLRYLYRILYF